MPINHVTRAHKKLRLSLRQRRYFLEAWLRSPLSIGAVVPSSKTLARAMAKQLAYGGQGAVIELGPGTGVVTQALLEAGIPAQALLVVERDARMHALMVKQFPQLSVLRADAMHLADVAREHGVKEVWGVVSSLPLLSMPAPVRARIVAHMAALMGQKGRLVQFTYGPKSPITPEEMQQHGLRGKRVKTVMANVPPAHIWLYQRERRRVRR